MELRRLGNSGLKVTTLGVGCNNMGVRLDQAGTQAVVDAAIDAGVNFFDTADVYGEQRSEVFLGKALGARRHDVIIATKFGATNPQRGLRQGGSRRWVMQAVEDSLKRLGTDYIDLYQVHMFDRQTPLEETLRAMDDLVRQGKVRYLGCSNYRGWQIADADWIARTQNLDRFISVQNLMSMLDRQDEAEVLPACERFGLGHLPFLPLAAGLLSGKYRRGQPVPEGARLGRPGIYAFHKPDDERVYDVLEPLSAFAEARGHTLLDLAFAWLLAKPAVSSVIAGAMTPEQVVQNKAAVEWRLTPEELQDVTGILG